MISAIENLTRVPELKKKILWTLALIGVYRIGVFIPIPGVNTEAVRTFLKSISGPGGDVVSMIDIFTGGALVNCTVLALGIMPYISASIIFQLLVAIVPALEKLAKEGETGRRKISQYTKYMTIGICLIQSVIVCKYLTALKTPGGEQLVYQAGPLFMLTGIMTLTAGTAFLMWLGDQMTEHGIGNGISIIIMASIVSRMPAAIRNIASQFSPSLQSTASGEYGILLVFWLVVLFVFMVAAVVVITLAQRRIPIQQARRTRGRRVYGGQRSYLPLRVNQAGVIPIIFASTLLMLPVMLANTPIPFLSTLCAPFQNQFSQVYVLSYIILIIFFSFFYTAIQFNPIEMSNNMKEGGTFIPGIRPGRKTSEYLEKILTRITFAGAIIVSFIAIVPFMIQKGFGVNFAIASLFGGTGLLIVVSVGLDVLQKIESYLVVRNYEGFMSGGRGY